MNALRPVRWSALRHLAKSPAHYKYALEHGVTETAAMRIGSAAHGALLGGGRRFVLYDGVRKGREWESFRDAQQDGATILNRREWDLAHTVALAVKTTPECLPLFEGSQLEKTLRWDIGGRACIGTPDALSRSLMTLADLKVTADASPTKFPWHAARQGWLAQLAWYSDAIDPTHSLALHIVAAEVAPPHIVTVYRLTDQAIEMGRRHYRALFERLMVCEESDSWPGYSQCIVNLDSPEELTITLDGEEIAA